MGTPLRAVVVGAGLMGRWHAHELRRAGGTLVGICDSERSAAERLANAHDGVPATDDLDELLALTAPGAVHVCAPGEAHVTIVEQALEAGAHALVEKPLAPNEKATVRLFAQADDAGLLVCPVHQYLFQPGFARAAAALKRHGPLVSADAIACSAGGTHNPAGLDPIVAEILPHPLAVLQQLLPDGVESLPWATAGGPGELRATAQAGDAVVSLHISMAGRPIRNEMRLIGQTATIHLDFFHGSGFVEPGGTSRAHKVVHPFSFAARRAGSAAANLAVRAVRREPAYPGLRELIGRFYAAIDNGKQSPIPQRDALAVAAARDQLVKHLRENAFPTEDPPRPGR